jgi:hypothetical protein
MQWMNMREFLRGGYREITEITVVANHGRPVFTVMPANGKLNGKAPPREWRQPEESQLPEWDDES